MTRKERLRRLIPGVVTLLAAALLFAGVEVALGSPSSNQATGQYAFTNLPIALPAGYNNQHMNTQRQVNPAYYNIRGWISSVGASIAMNDLTGHGRADGMCIVDTRTNEVIVTYTPTAPAGDRFAPFILNAAPLPMDNTMAPTGCTPGDFNGDGRMDLLITYWGRTPVLFMADAGSATLSAKSYTPQELVPAMSPDGKYHGARWNTDAAYVGDLNGSGHPDIVIGNYFPDSDVLDPNGLKNVVMNSSLSSAVNAGGDHVMRWYSSTTGAHPQATYVEDKDAIPFTSATGWTLAISGADLTGDGLPELYVANDFGHDHLLYNVSTPGQIKFRDAVGQRTPTTPKSFVLGKDSFKGMGVDFSDLNHTGKFDLVVSNIDQAWGLEESNFVFVNQAKTTAQMKSDLSNGVAPFTQEAQQYGLAWTGWCWDVKTGDFLNNGDEAVIQADGFVKGTVDRWPWLQEMAMTNDDLLSTPKMWPKVPPDADISGSDVLAFYARTSSTGKYVNISKQLGITDQIPTRAIATADTTGTGTLDFAVARQWGPPAFYANTASGRGQHLDFQLYRPSTGTSTPGQGLQSVGTPAYDASVSITNPQGTQISQLDGGGGHGGFRSFGVHLGLGSYTGPSTVTVKWRDTSGTVHQQTEQFSPGTHTLMLTDHAQEVSS